MNARLARLARWLHAHLAGAKLAQARDRQHRAAEELDKVVKEVLQR